MPMPTKNTATIISIIMPFCGDLELTPYSCFSKSSWSRLVILEFSCEVKIGYVSGSGFAGSATRAINSLKRQRN